MKKVKCNGLSANPSHLKYFRIMHEDSMVLHRKYFLTLLQRPINCCSLGGKRVDYENITKKTSTLFVRNSL